MIDFEITENGERKYLTIEFNSDNAQNLIVLLDGQEIAREYGEIISYPPEIQAGIIRGAAAASWERKKLKEIADKILAERSQEAA